MAVWCVPGSVVEGKVGGGVGGSLVKQWVPSQFSVPVSSQGKWTQNNVWAASQPQVNVLQSVRVRTRGRAVGIHHRLTQKCYQQSGWSLDFKDFKRNYPFIYLFFNQISYPGLSKKQSRFHLFFSPLEHRGVCEINASLLWLCVPLITYPPFLPVPLALCFLMVSNVHYLALLLKCLG